METLTNRFFKGLDGVNSEACYLPRTRESSVVGGKVKLLFKGDTMEIAQLKWLQLLLWLNLR